MYISSVPAQKTAKHPAKFCWPPISDVGAVTKPRRETGWNLLGCPKLPNPSQALVGQSSPYCEDIWRRYCCLTSFFPIVDTCLSCKDTADKICVMKPRWRICGHFLRPVFSARHVQQISDLRSKFALRPHHVWKYDRHPIYDPWDITRGKEERRKKRPQNESIMSASATQGGHE